MSAFETRFGAEDDGDRILAAFYGFVSEHEAGIDGEAHVRTEIGQLGRPELRVRLWSADAMAAFLRDLSTFERPDRRHCYE